MAAGFFDAMLRRPGWVLIAYSVILAALAQLPKIRLDALLLQGDPDLAYFRESAEKYSGDEFLILTWEPEVPLLSPIPSSPSPPWPTSWRALTVAS